MLYKNKISRIHKKLRKTIALVLAFLLLITILFEAQAVPFTKKCILKQSKSVSSKIIGKCVTKVIDDYNIKYDDLAVIKYSDSGNVEAISINSVAVNKIKSGVSELVQRELDKNKQYTFSLPLGAFTDITLLSTLGPEVNINFNLTGSVNCKLKSSFKSGGVNQTVHHISLTVKTRLISLSPEYGDEVVFKTDYEIAQTVIVGSIPSTYADIVR